VRRLELVVLIRPGQCQDSPLAAAADGASGHWHRILSVPTCRSGSEDLSGIRTRSSFSRQSRLMHPASLHYHLSCFAASVPTGTGRLIVLLLPLAARTELKFKAPSQQGFCPARFSEAAFVLPLAVMMPSLRRWAQGTGTPDGNRGWG
jgi:hypothetical protein